MSTALHAHLSPDLEQQATAALAEIGMTMDEAFELFLTQVIKDHDFALELKKPNAATAEAMAEFKRGEWTTCSSSEEMFALIDASE